MSMLVRFSTQQGKRAGSRASTLSFQSNLLGPIKRKPCILAPSTTSLSHRKYHVDGTYGYRAPRRFTLPDYTAEELANQAENANLLRLVQAYRAYGHESSVLDPLGLEKHEASIELDPKRYGLNDENKKYNLAGILHVNESKSSKAPLDEADLKTVIGHLNKVYCGRIAYEFMHIPNVHERNWFSHRVESLQKKQPTADEKRRIYELLARSEAFDHFMAKKFTQVKRYGLEGGESMMVALDKLFETSSKSGIVEVILGMPHRGRLNLLTDLLQFNPTALFHKVKGNAEFPESLPATGDVISHLASSPYLDYGAEKPLHVSMLHNPSHLEAVNPVAMGKARAKQTFLYEQKTEKECFIGDRVMCVQLHGDAAFTGQGVVMESLGLSNLPHFTSGGSVHIIVNNQIGYTTPAINARSTVYTSDIGKMVNAPVLHVNGDYPEDVALAATIAVEYRNKFRKDIILDLMTYRRWGHNELDEPAFTQPLMYQTIRSRKSVPQLYEEKLLAENVLSSEEVSKFKQDYLGKLEGDFRAAETFKPEPDHLKGKWSSMILPTETVSKLDTGVDADTLKFIGEKSVQTPEGMVVHPRLQKYHVQNRLQKLKDGKKIDWATAEALAIGSLLLEGYHTRISGQDVGRGTFSQRHAMLVCQETENSIIPLNNIREDQAKFEVANSSLSEMAVLGFEYGISIESPNSLNIWEAQFGDFYNSAQVIIDTYLSSSETKWLRQSGLVMLLPHGYDGAGPEHSSCHIERFLQLTNDRFNVLDPNIPVNPNMHVVNPTTPAQYFHLLRRQMKRNFRKPLIVAAPKVLLKSPVAISAIEDMQSGTTFLPVLGDSTISDKSGVERVVFVSGKLYYELSKERASKGLDGKVALVRVEELCPFPKEDIEEELSKYSNATEFVWCQEEPQNGGAYTFMAPRLEQLLPKSSKGLQYVGRGPSAAPATGIATVHRREQAQILTECFGNLNDSFSTRFSASA
ncbi:2-oxoglutarate dehydrogenase, E1 component [Basidiobolus meristosporus CBS 931.73]|uniref:2-oxoglutarate dehydrogenase, E1 component n=1 Tax=Basidiobolus meristosporus CBS 931.73 TaxID=1314790 RepID=A0A1Y1YGX7_9FUNG|nr:2-oxoglutarate dehydrogenase, E1 component [Basidiobolus meristosporus CBS 931.73]|eukprot:ORX97262.1 2-oxoglutarate dehydrogenase, E1 component [Basidiobolus meristosporus CBS 931.73]